MTWQEILEQSDIVEYVSQYIELQEKNGELWGMSPFKDENTPSFSIRLESQAFNDFSSGIGGNIFNFIMEYHKVDFPKAVFILKEYLNIKDDIEYVPQPQIIKTLKALKPKVKRVKVIDRKILSNNCMDKFEKTDITLWQEEDIKQVVMDKYSVRYDSIKQAIVFPIWDNNDKIINIKTRNIGKGWKELGLPKYCYLHKLGTIDFLWGLNFKRDIIKELKQIILVESEKSVMKLEGWGIENVVALCNGKLTDEQLRIIIQLGVNVVVALDKDKNPRNDENILKLKRFCKVEYIIDRNNLLNEKDSPCDKGFDIWNILYNERRT